MTEEQTRAAFEAAMVAAGYECPALSSNGHSYCWEIDQRCFSLFKLGLANREPSNYCPRCGKRNTGDADHIHTCSPSIRAEVDQDAARYRLVRTLTPKEFGELYVGNMYGGRMFDEQIDALIAEREAK